jgi:hypothetical protein
MNFGANNKFNGKKGRFDRDGPRGSALEPDALLCMLEPDGSILAKCG